VRDGCVLWMMVWRCCGYAAAATGRCWLYSSLINSLVGVVSAAGDEWPSPSCQYPDWLRRRTWMSLDGQLQFGVDGGGTALYRNRSMTSSMTSETGSARGSEYRCRQLSQDGTGYERHSSTTIQLSAFVLHDWSVVYTIRHNTALDSSGAYAWNRSRVWHFYSPSVATFPLVSLRVSDVVRASVFEAKYLVNYGRTDRTRRLVTIGSL